MPILTKLVALLFLCVYFFAQTSFALTASQFLHRPKLLVVLVIDQFRADYLTRLHDRFLKPGNGEQVGGFLFLMNTSAYFPFAEYDVLQNMTCPGHSMILTGTTPDLSGIPINEWYDRQTKKMVYCVEDAIDGVSPRHLRTTTVSDELKNSGIASKVIGIALKDRSSILLAGHRADLAIWFDHKNGTWTTSNYYAKDLPLWVKSLNEDLRKEHDKDYRWKTPRFEKKATKGSKISLSYPYGTEVTINAARKALKAENLGRNKGSDVLAISLSNHDFLGHWMGPYSAEIEELTLVEDQQISLLLTDIKKQMGGFADVTFVLTADHGVAPMVEDMKAVRIDAGKIDYLDLYKKIDERLDQKYGTPKNKEWISFAKNFHFYLNTDTLSEKKLEQIIIENEIREVMLSFNGVAAVFTKSDFMQKKFPEGMIGEQLKKQYLPEFSGDLVLIPKPFYFEKDDNPTTHMTGYSYDKQVPLLIMSPKVKAGVFPGGHIIDLASTLSFIFSITAPAANQGKVLPIF